MFLCLDRKTKICNLLLPVNPRVIFEPGPYEWNNFSHLNACCLIGFRTLNLISFSRYTWSGFRFQISESHSTAGYNCKPYSSSKMEKSATATNEKVSNHIPDDLAFSILSKLPLKSLKRFGCVRKSWTLLFENPNFINMYRNNFKDDASVLLKLAVPYVQGEADHSMLYLLSGERFENRAKLDWPPPFQDDDSCIHIFGSCVNGTFCLLQGSTRVVLWNPATEEFKVIPPSPVESGPPYREPVRKFYGFGYDHARDDYKVIRRVGFLKLSEDDLDRYGVTYNGPWDLDDISFDPLWEIYSLTSNSWRKLNMEFPSYCCGHGDRVYTNGVCHWWGEDEITFVVACLVSFDLSNEELFTTPMPSDMGDASFYCELVHLVVLNESIAFIYNYAETTTFQISILGELGVKESWTKLFIVGPLPCIAYPIGVGKKGDIFFRKNDGELAWFDLSTQMIVELGVKGEEWYCQIVIYKESLESLIPIGLEE